jgi:DNA-binding NtrC family response regulator
MFLRQIATELKLPPRLISAEALSNLQRYQFPGNIRELKNLIERAYILTSKDEMGVEEFPVPQGMSAAAGVSVPASGNGNSSLQNIAQPSSGPFDLSAFLDQTEKELIVRTLTATRGAQAEAARRLGLSRSALAYKLTKYNIRGTGE